MRTRRRYAAPALVLLWLVAGCLAGPGAPESGEEVRRELVLDDFESRAGAAGGRYVPLVNGHERADTDEVDFAVVPAREGRCLRVRYAFRSRETEEVGLRVDLGGIDASRYDRLSFRVRGDADEGFDVALKAGFRRPKPGAPHVPEDGVTVVSGVTEGWRRVVVPLNRLAGIRDWSRVDAFFVAIERRRSEDDRGAWCIDDVALLGNGKRRPTIDDPVVAVEKLAWERSVGGRTAALRRIRERLVGWPERLLGDRESFPADDREFLLRVARDTWRGVDELTDRENGLPLDHVILGDGSLAPEDADVGDYTSSTNVGLHLMAIVAAHELRLLPREGAIERITKLFDTLEGLERHQGFFFNFYDTVTLERTSNFISFVDSSWLTAGLIIARAAFPEVRERATGLLDAEDYGFFYDEVAGRMSHGYYVNVPVRSPYHYGVLYTEARLGSLIAIGKGDAPEEHWFRLVRTFPPEDDWQTQMPKGRRRKTVRGHEVVGGWYEWQDLRYVPSWGGSMFEALMPVLVVDERRHAPRSLGRNAEVHVEVQRRFAAERLGWPVWGLSPGAATVGTDYGEYGVPALGVAGYRPGAVTPYAAALALAIEPEEAIADLRRIATLYDSYGDYGFYDAVDPRSGQIAHAYLVLDQAMTLVAIANHLEDGCVRRHFEADPIAARALAILGEEDFFD